MNDFVGKVVRVSLDSAFGVLCATGPFVKMEGAFFAIINPMTNKIEYYSMYSIKSVTIVGETKADEKVDGVPYYEG